MPQFLLRFARGALPCFSASRSTAIHRVSPPTLTMTLTSTSGASTTPIEDVIKRKITEALAPTTLNIYNDSYLHAGHEAMKGTASKETHFRLEITSSKFEKLTQPARHRLVYGLLDEELKKEGGIHALQLKTRTEVEEERQKQRDEEKQ